VLWEAVKLALQSVRRNALRSSLTVLGVVIGVASVIAMVTIGQSTTAQVTAQLERLGVNLLVVRPGQSRRGPGGARSEARPFEEEDVLALRRQLRSAKAVAPMSARAATVVRGNANWTTSVVGTDDAYLVTQDWSLALGRGFAARELRGGRGVCMIGETVRRELFGAADPPRERIRIGKVPCEVIGVLAPKGQSSFGRDQDDAVLVPLRTFQRRIAGDTDVQTVFVSARDGVDTARVQREIEALLRERRRIGPGEADDFHVRDLRELIEAMTGTTTVLTNLLGAVAAVSLLVGGIGIMNIMLVSVTERTREIGIRLAVGALERQVLVQFLVEAVALALGGGLVGVACGLGFAYAATRGLGVPYVVDPEVVLLAFGSRRPSGSSSATSRPGARPASTRSSPSATSRRRPRRGDPRPVGEPEPPSGRAGPRGAGISRAAGGVQDSGRRSGRGDGADMAT